jgi:hypothetical protein
VPDLRLFDVPPAPAAEPASAPGRLSADARRTQRQRAQLAAGTHPATGRPLLHEEWGYRCQDCTHCTGFGHNLRTYWKCRISRLGVSHSAASDIRLSWPACTRLKIDPEDDA